jgi:hypothetical protein
MQDKRHLKEELERPARQLAPADAPVSGAVKRLVERLTDDYVPDKFINPSMIFLSFELN